MSDIRATHSIGTPQFKTISSSVVVAADFDELTQDDSVDAYQIIIRNGNLRWLPNTDPTTSEGNVWRQNKQDTISRAQFLTMRWIAESDDVLMLVTPQEEIIEDSWFLKDAEVVKAQTAEVADLSVSNGLSVEQVYGGEVEDDLRFPATTLKVGASYPPSYVNYKGGIVLGFADEGVNEDIVYFNVQLPHSWKEGSALEPHVHWVGEDNTAGNVVWKLTYSWANMGEAFPTETTITATGANSATTDLHNFTYFPSIDGAGKTYSSMLICSLSRNSTNVADTFTGKDAYLVEMDIHIIKDKLGTSPE